MRYSIGKFITQILLAFSTLSVVGQTSSDVLARANGREYTRSDLPAEYRELLDRVPSMTREARKQLLEQLVEDRLLEDAAKRAGTDRVALLASLKASIKAPSEATIKATYDANRSVIGDRTLADVRELIIKEIRHAAERKAVETFVGAEAVARKVAYKTIADPKPDDVLVTMTGHSITERDFAASKGLALEELKAEWLDTVLAGVENMIFNDLVIADAKSSGLAVSAYFGREVVDKMVDFTAAEKDVLESRLRSRLFAKYRPEFVLKVPPAERRAISIDDDPSVGPANAKVTIVMFSDLQCPACSATHPVLKRVVAEFPADVRLVVRDFPLEGIHENAFDAAVAANAAKEQGKFFEYIEILYSRQTELGAPMLKKYAAEIGLNVRKFELDLAGTAGADEVRRDIADGLAYGITSTPTIFVNGVRLRRLSAAGMYDAISSALGK
jgi:protein-disulfide isomerase